MNPSFTRTQPQKPLDNPQRFVSPVASIACEGNEAASRVCRPTDEESFLRRAEEVCLDAARGNLETRILHLDEASEGVELFQNINQLLDLTDAFVRESTAALEHASRGEFHRRVLLEGMLGAFRHAAESINEATAKMEASALALKEAEQRRAALAEEIRRSTEVVADLERASEEIGSMSNLIGKIASQSNMVALNAAIESARVGEVGQGFSVVAFEVKRLSDQTAQATKEISAKVAAIQAASKHVSSTIGAISESLHK